MLDTKERFFRATLELAGSGSIKKRLVGAYIGHLDDLESDQLPKSARGKFERLTGDLTRIRPLNGEGPVLATVRKMSKEEADCAAETIVSLYGQLAAARNKIV
ncbi:MAG: hypothetical protein O6931_06900 [Gammaproteobacteria bacterium]|nr:hypothetical protein [Gammaproteobacteria bacterium]